jgi:hypothetical protein
LQNSETFSRLLTWKRGPLLALELPPAPACPAVFACTDVLPGCDCAVAPGCEAVVPVEP